MGKTAILFPGQGSQQQGMGRALAEDVPQAMDRWKRAESISGLELRNIYWDGDDKTMADTRALQPALTVVNMNIFDAVGKRVSADFAAGHSLGEYSALYAAGVLAEDDLLELVSLRGRLMAEVSGGAMAAVVKLDESTVETLVQQARQATGKLLVVANYNSPAQFVVSGEQEAVDELAKAAKAAKGRAIPLPVSGAFHSPLMAEPAAELAGVLTKAHINSPSMGVVFNATGRDACDPEDIREAMTAQMTSSVHWIQTMAHLRNEGVERFVELGPGNVLTKLAQANNKAAGDYNYASVADVADVADLD